MKEFKRICLLIIGITFVGFGCAMTIKASIGLGAWDAFCNTLAQITNIKIGTMGIVCNCVCVCIQAILLKKDFTIRHLLQVPFSILLGIVINFMYYTVLLPIEINGYVARLVLQLAGTTICAFAVSIVMVLDIITLSVEGSCMAMTRLIKMKFSSIRQSLDVLCVLLVFILCTLFEVPISVREGTIIGMLIFGPMLGIFMKLIKRIFKKLDLLV